MEVEEEIIVPKTEENVPSKTTEPINVDMNIERSIDVEEEDDDPVVQEIDVFITNKLSRMMCLLQFPLRPATRNLDLSTVSEARFKSLKMGPRLEMDFSIPQGSTYNEESEWKIPSITLKSDSVPLRTNYAIGVLREEKGYRSNYQLHLTPIHNVMQMKPTLTYINEADAEKRKRDSELGDDKFDPTAKAQKKVGDISVVTPHFRKVQQPKTMLAKMHVEAAEVAREESETPFVNLKICDQGTDEYKSCFDNLICLDQTKHVEWNVSRDEYLELLAPTPKLEEYLIKQKRERLKNTLSLESLRVMDGELQVQNIMKATSVYPFSKIVELATNVQSPDKVVSHLIGCATLVDGRWTVASQLMLSNGLAQVRDYILLNFNQGKTLTLDALNEATGVEVKVLRQILTPIAVLGKKGQWSLKGEKDTEFIERYPHVVQSCQEYWDRQAQKIMNVIQQIHCKLIRIDGSDAGSSTNFVGAQQTDATELGKYQEPLKEFLIDLFADRGCCSLGFLKSQLNGHTCDDFKGNKLYGVKISDEFFLKVLSNVAQSLHNTWFLKTRDDDENKKIRNIVIEIFKDRTSISKSDIKRQCIRLLNSSNVPAKSLKAVLSELTYVKGNMYFFKQGDGTDP